ncbi:M1 family metallopeptidase [Rufibacter roseus]|uniref:Aminopeptidase N n=1 Tax=Rufibacter roseus TaxID=1567108 RepID=A0ABW2DNK5_9BACT|nr:M1 family metallopeptidase [Rufibacter roseus]
MNHILSRAFLVFAGWGLIASCAVKQPSGPVASVEPVVVEADTVAEPQRPLTSHGPYRPAAERVMDLLHTKLNIKFDWAKQHLLGEATLTLKPYFYPQDSVVLDAKGFEIHKVTLLNGKTESPLPYKYDQEQLVLQLGKSYTRKDTLRVFISYTAKPNELKVKGSDAIVADKGLYFINPLGTEEDMPQQIWTQGETEASSAWFPTIDRPNERMTQDFYITVEDRFKTLSNGVLVSSQKQKNGFRTDHWRMTKSHAPYLAMMAIGEYAVVKDKWRNIEVSYWVEPEYAATAKATFGRTPEMMEFFSQKLGVPFPWEKYAQVVVRNFVSGAMENTTASTFMESLHQDRRQLLDKNWDHIIAHELFHQWFGDLVTTESWSNLPLNESFADYSEYLWAEHKYGADEAALVHQEALQQYLNEARTKQEPLIRYRYLDKEDMFDSHSYAKGGRVLHMLRKLVGDEAFFLSLNHYLTQHKYTAVEVDELRMSFEEVTGKDLKPFFDQWFLQPGHPVLDVTHSFSGGSLMISVSQVQDTTLSPVYAFPLTISFLENGEWQQKEVEITKANHTFNIAAAAAPQAVVLDPEQNLLANFNHQKTLEEWAAQFLNGKSYAAKSEALEYLREQNGPLVAQVVQQAMQDPFWKIRATALELLIGLELWQQPQMQQRVETMSVQDPNSTVRSTAMYALSTLTGLPEEVIRKGLRDSSYQVVAASIFAWNKSGKDVQAIKPYMTYKNADVVNALAASLTDAQENEVYDWYLANARRLRGADLYYFIQSLGAFLLKKDIDGQERGWQALVKIVQQENMPVVKQAGFQMLTYMAETEERKQALQNVLEQDEQLQEWVAGQNQ